MATVPDPDRDQQTQMEMNRLMSKIGNLGIGDGAAEQARKFISSSQSKINSLPTVEKVDGGGLHIHYIVGKKELLLDFHEDGSTSWKAIEDEQLDDSGDSYERIPSLVNWLIHN